jgi:uncharacterized membrane protein YecN with MAPEG domain
MDSVTKKLTNSRRVIKNFENFIPENVHILVFSSIIRPDPYSVTLHSLFICFSPNLFHFKTRHITTSN